MNRRFRFALDGTLVGTVLTGIAGQGVLVVSGVLVARNLGAHDRGELALIVAIAIASSFIISLGIPTAVAFTVAHDRQAARGALHAIRRLASAQLVTAAVLTAVAVLLFLNGDRHELRIAACFVPFAAAASIVLMYGLAVLQGQSRFLAFNLLRLAPGVGYTLGVVLIIAFGAGSVSAFVIAWSVAYCAAAVAIVATVRRTLQGAPSKQVDGRELLGYGVKAQVGTASPLENFQIDQLLVGAIAGPAALGFYVIGAAFTNLPRFIAQSLGMVVFPRVAGRLGKGGARMVAKEALYATILLAGGTVVMLEILMGWLVPFFFGSAFEPSVPVARIMLIGAFCFSLRRVISDALRGANRPLAGTIAEAVAWAFYGALVVPMTIAWEAKGAAIAIAIAAAASLMFIAFSARRASLQLPATEVVTVPPAPQPS